MSGNAACNGHTECDAIIMDKAAIRAVPEISANSTDASLIHEAAIGKIAGEQIIKLMTLGLTEAEATEMIVMGFIEPFAKELPMEYAVELNQLIKRNL